MFSQLAFLAILPSLTLSHAGAPTAAQILANCQKAYDSVNTFEVEAKAASGMLNATAHISFSRSSGLRVTGDTSFGSKYELLLVGKSAQVYNGGSWAQAKTPEIGLATITGISATAPTQVCSLLLHTQWGALAPASLANYSISEEKVRGRDTYRLRSNGQMRSTVWIDKKTFFLVKSHAEIFKTNIDVVLSTPKVNQVIPSSRFLK